MVVKSRFSIGEEGDVFDDVTKKEVKSFDIHGDPIFYSPLSSLVRRNFKSMLCLLMAGIVATIGYCSQENDEKIKHQEGKKQYPEIRASKPH